MPSRMARSLSKFMVGRNVRGAVEVLHDGVGSAVGVELDSHGSFELYALRRPVADHKLG
jgi:hypothetical protein